MVFGPCYVAVAATLSLVGHSAGPGNSEVEIWAFSASWCGACRQMEPTLAQLEAAGIPIRRIDADRHPDLVRRFGIQALPTFVAVIAGQPTNRIVGATSGETLRRLYEQALATASRTGSSALPPEKGSPGEIPRANTSRTPLQQSTTQIPVVPVTAESSFPGETSPHQAELSPSVAGGSPVADSTSQATSSQAEGTVWAYARTTADLLLATVRLRIRDPRGQSCGSGTIVDARSGEALILTCGHIFRDSKGQGTIEVDLFGPQPAEKLPGRLLAYDLQRDLGLLVIRPPGPVMVARIAPPGTRLVAGMAVISVGCDHGNRPTARFSRITAVDKYVGPANVVISGMPVEGRSGGGLFTEEGLLIGVCNAADPKDGEGLFAALPAIHELLSQKKLAFVYSDTPPPPLQVSGAQLAGQPSAGNTGLSADSLGLLADSRGSDPSPARSGSLSGDSAKRFPQFASGSWEVPSQPEGNPPSPENPELSPAEEALLATLARRIHEGAELLWVVRPRQGSPAQGEIVSFDQLSPAFLARLAELTRTLPRRTALTTPENESTPTPGNPSPPPQARGRVLLEFRGYPHPANPTVPSPDPSAMGWGPGRSSTTQP